MRVGVVLDDVFLEHRPPLQEPHPERPERIVAIAEAFASAGLWEKAERLPAREATDEELARVHDARYLAALAHILPGKTGYLDADTYFSPGTWAAARAAAGATVDLALASVSGRLPRGFAVVRPPGHHALAGEAMGFCLLNNVAVAAAAARAAGCARVAIVDWDVHHGNGTEAIFWQDPTVLYISTHQYPYYPGSGAAEAAGEGAGRGATLNVPLPAGAGDAEYRAAFEEKIVPALRAFKPELILVSAGFDAFAGDPLAEMQLSVEGYRDLARLVRQAADELCGGRMVCVLEGGYDLEGLGACAAATLAVLAEGA